MKIKLNGGIILKFDLHVHTDYSDGVLSPEEVVDLAIKRNLDGIAITDHDSIKGVNRAIKYSNTLKDFKVIPGIEFSCVYRDEAVHILGYFIDIEDEDLLYATKKFRDSRRERSIKIIDNLKDLNIDINFEDIFHAGDKEFIGRTNIARELVRKSYVKNTQEAFNRYLKRGRPGYVERFHISIEDTVNLINKAGGISVIAHPGLLKDRSIVNYCIEKGIEGIECIHSKHSKNDVKQFKEIAQKHDLIITGGSDFHEKYKKNYLMGKYYIDLDTIPEFKERL